MFRTSKGSWLTNTLRDLEEYLKRFLLSIGYPATSFASNRHRNAASLPGPRCLIRLCNIGSLFAGRYCRNDPTVAWTSEPLIPIIKSIMTSEDKDVEGDKDSEGNRDDSNSEDKRRQYMPRSKAESCSRKSGKVKQSLTGSLLTG